MQKTDSEQCSQEEVGMHRILPQPTNPMRAEPDEETAGASEVVILSEQYFNRFRKRDEEKKNEEETLGALFEAMFDNTEDLIRS